MRCQSRRRGWGRRERGSDPCKIGCSIGVRTGWSVSEIGYGMWGMAGWTGSEDAGDDGRARAGRRAGLHVLRHRLGLRRRAHRAAARPARGATIPDRQLYVGDQDPAQELTWPSRRGFSARRCFPPEHIREYAEKSLANLGLPRIDLLQFHVWEDAWAHDERWQRAMDDLKRQGLIRAVGISVNRWEPDERARDAADRA